MSKKTQKPRTCRHPVGDRRHRCGRALYSDQFTCWRHTPDVLSRQGQIDMIAAFVKSKERTTVGVEEVDVKQEERRILDALYQHIRHNGSPVLEPHTCQTIANAFGRIEAVKR